MGKSFKGFSKALSLILAVAMVVTMVPTSAYGAELIAGESEDILISNDAVAEEASDALIDASASEDNSSTSIDTQKASAPLDDPDENTAGEEDILPDKTAQDVELNFAVYNTATAINGGSGSTKNTLAPQNLVINDFYAADYDPLYYGNGDGDGDGESDTEDVAWDHENDYKFFLSPLASHELPMTGDDSVAETVKITYVDKTGLANTAPGTTKTAVAGTDFTVGEADKNGRVLITVKASFLGKALDARDNNAKAAGTPAAVGVDVDTVATEKFFEFKQSGTPKNIEVTGDGGLLTIGTDALKAYYTENYIFTILDGTHDVLNANSQKANAVPVKEIKLSYTDEKGKKQTLTPGTTMSSVTTSAWTGTDNAKPTYYSNTYDKTKTAAQNQAAGNKIIFAIRADLIQKFIGGIYTDPVITVAFGETASTDLEVVIPESVTDVANYHVGLAAATATKAASETAVVVSFKGKDNRVIEKIFYTINDETTATELTPTQQSSSSAITATDNTWSGTAAGVANIPQYWYYATVPAADMVGSKITLTVQTAEALTFTVDKNLSDEWYASVEDSNAHAIAVGGTSSAISTAETSTSNAAYTFKVTPVTGRAVDTVKYTVQGGNPVALEAAADGVTYTIPANVINKPTTIAVTTKAASATGKNVVASSLSNITSIKDLSGGITIGTTVPPANAAAGLGAATLDEYFYFRVTPATNHKVSKVEYTDAGTSSPTTKLEATEISRTPAGVVTYKTSTKVKGNITLYPTIVEGVTVVKPVNKLVTFKGYDVAAGGVETETLNPTKGDQYAYTITPVASSMGETRIVKVSYILDANDNGSFEETPVESYNSKVGKSGSHSGTLTASHAVKFVVETKVVVNNSKYTAIFGENFPDTLGDHDYPNLIENSGAYTLELSNDEAKVVGAKVDDPASGYNNKNLYAVFKNSSTGREIVKVEDIDNVDITNITIGANAWVPGKTANSTKVIDVDAPSETIKGNRLATITDQTDAITVTQWVADTSNVENAYEYTATLGVKVYDRFREIKLLSTNLSTANSKETYGEGYLVKASGANEELDVIGIDGRTAEPSLVDTSANGDLYGSSADANKKYVVWTVSPDYSTKSYKAYTYALTEPNSVTHNYNKVINTITYNSTTEIEYPESATATATVTDKWGKTYDTATATVTLIDDPVDYVVVPTITRANSAPVRGYDGAFDNNDGYVSLEADGSINNAVVDFSIYQQARATSDLIEPQLVFNSTKEEVAKSLAAGDYNEVSDVAVNWELADLVFDHTGIVSDPLLAGLYYVNGGVWEETAAGVETAGRDYYKLVPSTTKNPNKYVEVTGSGLSWTIKAIAGAQHDPSGVAATVAFPSFKRGNIALDSFSSSLAASDASVAVTVGGRIAKDTVRLFLNDNTYKTTAAPIHVIEQKLSSAWASNAGVASTMTTLYDQAATVGTETTPGYSIGVELPEITDGSYFTLPGMNDFETANLPEGRAIYGWYSKNGGAYTYYDVNEKVAVSSTAKDFYAIWGPKVIVTDLYNDNLTNKDSEGKDVISAPLTATDTYTLLYDGVTDAKIPVGLGVKAVKGIISTAEASTGTPGYADLEAIAYSKNNVKLTETDGAGNALTTGQKLDQTLLASGTIKFVATGNTNVSAAYVKDGVEYTWNGAYTDAIPTMAQYAKGGNDNDTQANIAALTNYMAVGTNGVPDDTNLAITQDTAATDYELTLSDVASMKANTTGAGITATLKTVVGTTKTPVPYFGTTKDSGSNTCPGTYTWTSSNEAVATIKQTPTVSSTDIDGMNTAHIYPKSAGTTKITFTYVDPYGVPQVAESTLTVTAQSTFVKFTDKDGKVIDDPEFLETYATSTTASDRQTVFYVMAAGSDSATDYNAAITGGSFAYEMVSGASTYVTGITFEDVTGKPGLVKATIQGAQAYGKDDIRIKYTDTDTSVVAKEVPFKTYRKVIFSAGGAMTDNSTTDFFIVNGKKVYKDGSTTNSDLTNTFIKVYSTDVKKEAVTGSTTNFLWSYEIDLSHYQAEKPTKDFKGWYLAAALTPTDAAKDGSQVKTVPVTNTNTTAVKGKVVFYDTAAAGATADNTVFSGADVTVVPYLDNAAITNVSGIPSEVVKLNDSVTTGATATTNKNIELGVTPYNTTNQLRAIAEDEGLVSLYNPYVISGTSNVADHTYVYGTDSAVNALTMNNLYPVSEMRTDVLGIGMVQGKAGKTTIHITNGLPGDAKVEYGSFTVAISGAKWNAGKTKIEGYYDENGELLKNASKVIGSKTYYFDEEGATITDGICKLEDGWVLIAGGVKETVKGLHDLAGKTYCIKADGTVAKNELSTVDGKDYVFREDGTMVKYLDADVDADHKATVNGVVYVIASDNTAKQDDKKIVTKVGAFVWTPAKNKDYKKDTTVTATLDVEYKMEKAQTTGKETLTATVVLDPSSTATKKIYTATVTASGYYKDATTVYDWTTVKATKTYTVDESGDGKKDEQGGSTETEPSQPDDKANWNLFYTGFEMNLNLPSGADPSKADSKAKWTQFYTVDGSTVTLKSGADPKKAASASNSLIVVPVFDTDNNEIGDFEYSLPVFYSEPKLKLTSKQASFSKLGEAEQTFTTTVLEEKSNKIYEPLELDKIEWTTGKGSLKSIDTTTNTGEVEIVATGAANGKIKVQNDNWSKPVELAYKVAEAKKNVLTASTTKINFNSTTDANADQKVTVLLNGSDTIPDGAVTVTMPKGWDASNMEIDGIEEGKVTKSEITFSVKSGEKPVPGNYSFKMSTSDKVSVTVKVAVSKKTLDKAVKLNVKAKMDLTTNQPMVIVPELKEIGGEITAAEFDSTHAALFDANINGLGQIVVTAKDPAQVSAKTTYKTTLTVTVGGAECGIALNFKPNATKPKVKIDKITLPKKALTTDGKDVEGEANVLATYKYNKKTFTIAPTKVEFDKATKNESDETISPKGLYKLTYDETTGTIKVEKNSTVAKAETVKVILTFPGNVQVKQSLNIKVNSKK